jgi:hypothetical protein
MDKPKNVLLEWALWYAKKGWPVIALHTPSGTSCSCDRGPLCTSQGKHPRHHCKLLPRGCNSATTDLEKINKWWDLWPDANIGIATGKHSFTVLDVDLNGEGIENLRDFEHEYGGLPDTIEQITGSGGRQIMFSYCPEVGNEVRFSGGLDTRSDGGLVVVPPSMHKSGKRYEWEASSRPQDGKKLAPMPRWLVDLIFQNKRTASGNGGGVDVAKILSGLEEGKRDEELFRYSCRLRSIGLDKEEAKPIILAVAAKCKPPFDSKLALKKVEQAWKYTEPPLTDDDYPGHPTLTTETDQTTLTTLTTETDLNKLKQTHPIFKQTLTNSANYLDIFKLWLETCDGEFKMQDAARELGWFQNPSHYAAFRNAVFRAAQIGLIARSGKLRGLYRTIKKGYEEADLLSCATSEFPIVLPLGLHDLVEINPKEIILISGETNAGKTSLIYNIMWDNIFHFQEIGLLRQKHSPDCSKIGIRYFSSEMGPSSIKKKLLDFGPSFPLSTFVQNVTTICDRSTGFQDILDPEGLNCIDYLEPPNGDYYLMAPTITEVFSKLTTGVAVIGIQKKFGSDIARGGEATLEKPRLAIALSYNKEKNFFTAKITKAKTYRGDHQITGKEIDFLIDRGVKIIPVSGWGYPDAHEKRRKTSDYRFKPPNRRDYDA